MRMKRSVSVLLSASLLFQSMFAVSGFAFAEEMKASNRLLSSAGLTSSLEGGLDSFSGSLVPFNETKPNANLPLPDDGMIHLSKGSFNPKTQSAPAALLAPSAPRPSAQLYPASIAGPERDKQYIVKYQEVYSADVSSLIASLGGEVFGYIPNDACRIRIHPERLNQLLQSPMIIAVHPVLPAYRIDGELLDANGNILPFKNGAAETDVDVLLWKGTDLQTWLDWAISAGAKRNSYSDLQGQQLTLRVTADLIHLLSGSDDVIFISPVREKELLMNIARGSTKTDAIQERFMSNGLQLDGRTEIVAVSDTGIDVSHPALNRDSVNTNKIVRSFDYGFSYNDPVTGATRMHATSDQNGHGTHVAGIIAGNGANSTANNKKGIAPAARLIPLYFFADNSQMMQDAWNSGARVSNNSWKYTFGGTANAYRMSDWYVDEFIYNHSEWDPTDMIPKQTFVYVGAAGNNGSFVESPNGAKNMITVGATVNNSDANPTVSTFSARGPAQLNRIKPDVMAPGENVVSTRSANSSRAEFAGNTSYTSLSGTSMATPMVSGLAALIRQFYRSKGFTPSSALVKATLINGTSEILSSAGTRLSRNDQGWGFVNLEQSISPGQWAWSDSRLIRSGQTTSYKVRVADSTKPLVTTISWTDPPIDPAALDNATNDISVTDLNLYLISPSGLRYRSESLTNSVEKITVNNPDAGEWTIEISGTRVPELRGKGQSFAMVVRGASAIGSGDVTPPSAIPNFNVAVSGGSATLSWTTPADHTDVIGYYVFAEGSNEPLATTMTNRVTIDGLGIPGKPFRLFVRSRDHAGNVSAASPIVQFQLNASNSALANGEVRMFTIIGDGKAVNLDAVNGTVSLYNASSNELAAKSTNLANIVLGQNRVYFAKLWTTVRRDTNTNQFLNATLTLNVPITAPLNASVTTVTDSSVSLQWDAPASGTVSRYEVFRNETSVGVANGLTFTDNNLEPDTTYVYQVRAYNFSGILAGFSPELTVKTKQRINNQITLYYKNDKLVLPYTLYYKLPDVSWSSAVQLPLNTSTYNSFRSAVISLGQATSAEVKIYNGSTWDDNSGTSYKLNTGTYTITNGKLEPGTPVVDTEAPSVPAGLKINAKTNVTVDLAWNASTDNVGVTGYEVHRDGVKIADAPGLTYRDTQLKGNTAYRYQVMAYDSSGNKSAQSSPLAVSTDPDPNRQVTVYYKNDSLGTTRNIHYQPVNGTWTVAPGIRMDASEFAGYHVKTVSIGNANGIVAAFNNGSVWDSNLGKNYSLNTGIWTITNGVVASGKPAVDTQPPTVPTGLAVASKSSDRVSLTWVASTDNVGIARYELLRDGKLSQNVSGTSFTDTGLTAGTTYSYQLRAIDTSGNTSALGAALQVTTDTVVSNNVTVYYKHSRLGSTVNMHFRPSNGVWTVAPGMRMNASANGYAMLTVPIGNSTGIVAAFNNGSAWENNNNLNYTIPSGVWTITDGKMVSGGLDNQAPTVPSGTRTTGKSDTGIDLAWTASSDNIAVTGYDVFRNGTKVGTVTSPAFSDTGLTGSTTYSYTIAAFDAAGNRSALSSAYQEVTNASQMVNMTIYYKNSTISGPVNFFYRQINGTEWTPVPGFPMKDSGINGYYLITVQTTANQGVVGSFNNGTNWDNNGGSNYVLGPGTWTITNSVARNGTPDTIPPTVPSGLKTDAKASDRISISWNPSFDNESAIVSYDVFRNGVKAGTVTANKFQDTGLSAATVYKYTVVASDPNGNRSASSVELQETTDSASAFHVTVYYKNSAFGSKNFFHYRQANGTLWTNAPGVALTASPVSGYHWLTLTASSSSGVVGAFNNGTSWDNNKGLNYSFTQGTFTVTDGVITSGAPASNKLTIYYKKNGNVANIHYQPAGGSWTVAPGVRMTDSTFSGFAVIELNIGNASAVTAAFNNENGVWDSNGGKNYSFTTGTFTVNNGAVKTGTP